MFSNFGGIQFTSLYYRKLDYWFPTQIFERFIDGSCTLFDLQDLLFRL